MQVSQEWLVTASTSDLCLLRGDIDLLSSWTSQQLPALLANQLLQQLPQQVLSFPLTLHCMRRQTAQPRSASTMYCCNICEVLSTKV